MVLIDQIIRFLKSKFKSLFPIIAFITQKLIYLITNILKSTGPKEMAKC